MAKSYDQLNKLAPTIEMPSRDQDLRASAKVRLDAFAKIFGKEEKADQLQKQIDESFAAIKAAAQGKGLVILVNGNKISAFGPDSRFGWIYTEFGIPTVDNNIKQGTHGQPISFEYIKQHNPNWLFVFDRSAAIGQEGAAAQEVLNNPLIAEINAWKNGHVVYLSPSIYLGAVEQLLQSSTQIREAFEAAK